MIRLFRNTRKLEPGAQRQKGLSLMETIVGLGALSIVAVGAAGATLMIQRSQNQNKAQATFNALKRRLGTNLKTGVSIRKTSEYNPTNISAGQYPPDGNRMLKECLRDDGDTDQELCFHFPPPPYQRPLDNQYDSRRIVLIDPSGNVVHPNLETRWTLDGRMCDGQNGRPAYNAAYPDQCPFITNVRYTAYCDDSPATGERCAQARAFKFYYTVEMANVSIPGVARLAKFDSLQSDPIYYTIAEITKMSVALPNDCDYENGYAVSGINSDGTLRCARVSGQVTPLAVHSMTVTQPTCSFSVRRYGASVDTAMTFSSLIPDNLLTFHRSFGGAWFEQTAGTRVDLGKPESCNNLGAGAVYNHSVGSPPTYYSGSEMLNQCTGSGSSMDCRKEQDGMYSMWLAAVNSALPTDTLPRSSWVMSYYMSRCNVCEIPGPVMAVHNFNHNTADVAPSCPEGWDRLYTGRSLGALSLDANDNDAGYSTTVDLSSPGSCLPMPLGLTDARARVPFLECKHFKTGSGTYDQAGCFHRTGSDYSLWYTRSNGNIFQCSVCYKPPKLELAN